MRYTGWVNKEIWASFLSLAFIICLTINEGSAANTDKVSKFIKKNKITSLKKTGKVTKNQDKQKANAKAAKIKTAALKQKGNVSEPEPVAAKTLFGAVRDASPLASRAIGSYVKGCLAGGKMLPVDGPAWQAMRLSRNRNWGHPRLVKFVERLAVDAKEKDKWPGLLVGDLAQPRGGPMLSGHSSHQIGLDADIWLTPMPSRILSPKEREDIAATTMLNADMININPKVWTDGHVKLLKRAASYPEVARIFVHPAIKKALCTSVSVKKMIEVKVAIPSKKEKGKNTKETSGQGEAKKEKAKLVETMVVPEKEQAWLSRIRPWWGHHYHFHVRINCPAGSAGCENQPQPSNDDGCGKELATWMKRISVKPKYPVAVLKPAPAKSYIKLSDLPKECVAVLGPDNMPTAIARQDTSKTAAGGPALGSVSGGQTLQTSSIPGVQTFPGPATGNTDVKTEPQRTEPQSQTDKDPLKSASRALPVPDRKPAIKNKTAKLKTVTKPVKKKKVSKASDDKGDQVATN